MLHGFSTKANQFCGGKETAIVPQMGALHRFGQQELGGKGKLPLEWLRGPQWPLNKLNSPVWQGFVLYKFGAAGVGRETSSEPAKEAQIPF